MTATLFLLAAGLAAIGRHAIGRRMWAWQSLLVVNALGSIALGWVIESDVGDGTAVVLGVGLCGTFTTYSSFALEVRALGLRLGSLYAAVMVVLATSSALLGMRLA